MSIEQSGSGEQNLKEFQLDSDPQSVEFVGTERVCEGVECDVYVFIEDDSKDLGIIKVAPGFKTPLQRVVEGLRTIEGHVSGEGQLTIIREGGNCEIHDFCGESQNKALIDVNIGDLMQWKAIGSTRLVAFEICYPPYQEGRYEEIAD